MDGFLYELGFEEGDFHYDELKTVRDNLKRRFEKEDLLWSFSDALAKSLVPFKVDRFTYTAGFVFPFFDAGLITEEELKELVHREVWSIIFAMQKIDELNYKENDRSSKLEIFRLMFLSMARDIRVVLLVLSKRQYLMENLSKFFSPDDAFLYAEETMNVYVPISSRLGIYRIKNKLEDLSFARLNPDVFNQIASELKDFDKRGKATTAMIKKTLEDFLLEKNVKASVSGRIKGIYSIYRKLKKKGLTSVKDIYDIFAMRIVLPQIDDSDSDYEILYSVLGLIHSEWKPISSRFKDYIAVPKPNGYRSLHTVILGLAPKDEEKPVEIQLRDEVMHSEAEYGVASHWVYKEGIATYQSEWLKRLRNVSVSLGQENEFVREVETGLFRESVFVLTPKGEVKDFSRGACVLDFAYAVHTDVGNHCLLGKVDGKVVPLGYQLKNGDVVEIVTRNNIAPKLEWLSLVKTSQAKNKIKSWFNKFNKKQNVQNGRRILNRELNKVGKPNLDQKGEILNKASRKKLNLDGREKLLEEIGKGVKLPSDVVNRLYPKAREKKSIKNHESFEILSNQLENKVEVGGESGLPIKFTKCCNPRMNDNIVGYVTRGNRISVHKKDCSLLTNLDSTRILTANWK